MTNSVPALSEYLLEERATAAAAFKSEKGSLEGFDDDWKAKEASALVTAKTARDAAIAKANEGKDDKEKPKEKKPAPDTAGLKRSTMSTHDKTKFIEDHGEDAFRAIPWA